MKIAVIGAGAIGSLVAGYLAKAGEDVLLVGRGEQVEAIGGKGLVVRKSDGAEKIFLPAARKIEQKYELVVFCVKTQDMEEAYQQNQEFLDDSLILTTQNGVQADNILSVHFDPAKIISSIVMFGATYIQPGEVVFNFPGNWIMGKPFTANDREVIRVQGSLQKAFPVVVTSDIVGMKWLKLFINFNNCLPALIGRSMQETFADLDFCRLSIMLLREGLGIVQDAGIKLVSLPDFPAERMAGLAVMPMDQAAGIIHKTLTTLSREPLYGSILQSILRKKTSEIDFINGEVAVLAKGVGRRAPLNSQVVDLVHVVERRGKFFSPEEIKDAFKLTAV
ncbi:MAG: 2-dehydropantoate 2-reductase [Candidatus Omnitrophota bacterium]